MFYFLKKSLPETYFLLSIDYDKSNFKAGSPQ